MRMIKKIQGFIELTRLDKPIGIYLLFWPSFLGLLLGGLNSGYIEYKNYLIGCFVDFWNYKIGI